MMQSLLNKNNCKGGICMSLTNRRKNEQGFTIIEVLIVLAIAGLILLIVFLAVPALQRSQRNNARKNDAARITSAVSTFVSNSNGTEPAAQSTADEFSLLTDAGKFGQFTFKNTSATVGATQPEKGYFDIDTWPTTNGGVAGTKPALAAPADDTAVLVENAQCSGSTTYANSTPSLTVPYSWSGTTNSSVLLYTVETGSGYIYDCDTAQ
jgi:prepilin-type N-terminal cleavage/methylation domain-containing protein